MEGRDYYSGMFLRRLHFSGISCVRLLELVFSCVPYTFFVILIDIII